MFWFSSPEIFMPEADATDTTKFDFSPTED